MAINTQKLLPSASASSASLGKESQNRIIAIKTSVIKIENVLKGTIALEKKQKDDRRKEQEDKKFKDKENQLEKKKIKSDFKINLPSLPKMGFFDWIRNFITNVLVGYFVVRFIKYLPKLQGVLDIAGKAFDGVIDIGGKMLNGLATFVEWGYKAYDATRGFLRNFGGDATLKLFDQFTSGLDTFLTLVLGYNALSGGLDLIGPAIGRILGGLGLTLGTGAGIGVTGKILSQKQIQTYLQRFGPKLAEAQEKTVGIRTRDRIKALRSTQRASILQDMIGGDISSPLKPSVATLEGVRPSDRKKIVRMADPNTPPSEVTRLQKSLSTQKKLTGSQQKVASYMDAMRDIAGEPAQSPTLAVKLRPKSGIAELASAVEKVPSARKQILSSVRPFLTKFKFPIIGALIDFGLSVALGEDPGRAAFRSIGSGLLGGIGTALGGGIGLAGGPLSIVGATLGGIAGGTLGDLAAGAIYDLFFGNKASAATNKFQGRAEGGPVTRAGQSVGGPPTRGLKREKVKRTIKEEPQPTQLKPGSGVGGDKAIKKMFPEPEAKDKNKTINPYGYVQDNYKILSDVSFFGPLFGIAIKTLTGDEPKSSDYRNASIGLSNWMISSFGSVGMPGYASGGIIKGGVLTSPEELTKVVEKSLEDRISGEVDRAINDLRRRLGLEPLEGKGAGATPITDGDITGLQGNAKEFYDYLISKGLSPNNAMGLVLNAARETGFNYADQHIDTNGLPVGGVFQWNGPRFTNLQKEVPDWKTNWKGQLDYALRENNLSKQYLTMNFSSPLEAANWWMREWERPANPAADELKHKQIYDKWIAQGMKQGQGPPATLGSMPGNLSAAQQLASQFGLTMTSFNTGEHAKGSLHYQNRAMDFSNGVDTPEQKAFANALIAKYGANIAELIYTPLGFSIKDGKKVAPIASADHYDHVHVAFFGGGPTGKGGLTMTHPGEYIIDKDSVNAFGQSFFDIINQTESTTQRKNAAARLIGILKNYIPEYDSRYENTVVIPVPQPQMVPVPIPISSGGGYGVSGESKTGTHRFDVLDSLG